MRLDPSAAALAAAALLACPALAADLNVPGDFPDLASAVAGAAPGDRIVLAPGDYTANLTLTIPLTIAGPNVGVDPCTGVRGPEATLTGHLTIGADDVTIEGLRFTGTPAGLAASIRQRIDDGLSQDRATIRHNLFQDVGRWAVYHQWGPTDVTSDGWVVEHNQVDGWQGNDGTGLLFWNMSNLVVRDNCVDDAPVTPGKGSRGIGIDSVAGALVTGNTVTGLDRWGMQLADSFFPQVGATFRDNLLEEVQVGLQLVGLNSAHGITDVDVLDNDIRNVDAIAVWITPGSAGPSTFDDVLIAGNDVVQDVGRLIGDFGLIDVRLDPTVAPHGQVAVAGNVVRLNGTFGAAGAAHGIKVRGAAENVVIDGNVLDGGAVGSAGGTPPSSGIWVTTDDANFGPLPPTTSIVGVGNEITRFDNGITVYDPVAGAYGGLPAGALVALEGGLVFDNAVLGVASGPGGTIQVRGSWWGDASGPLDPVGTSESDGSACSTVADILNADGLGDGVSENVEYCPWADGAGTLALEVPSVCLDDQQITVDLYLRDVLTDVDGYMAEIDYPDAVLTYRGDLSSYTSTPFALNSAPIALVEVAPGKLLLDGYLSLGASIGASADALLATLVFDVDSPCASTSIDFSTAMTSMTMLSSSGIPIPAIELGTGGFELDSTPPVLDPCPADLVVAADADVGDGCQGAVVNFALPSALDACDGATPVVPSVPSGSLFPVGTTTVTLSTADSCGNASQCSFDVTVTPTNLVDVVVELPGSEPGVRCIEFVADECSTATSIPLMFAPTGTGAVAVATVELPCGDWSTLCAKDAQHTLWDTVALVASGPTYAGAVPLVLGAGDTDDDGGVDINDVTFLIAQFGSTSIGGGCPHNGARDADFDNDGVVATPDYGLLVGNWLALTDCACTAPAASAGRDRLERSIPVRDAVSARADLNGDGRVDVEDVERFEERHGLSGELSERMRRE